MTGTRSTGGALRLTYVGGPTALIELGAVRLLTDPTFDPPGEHPVGTRVLNKTVGPALDPSVVGPLDVVLLSHDQHPDNLDAAGRRLLATVPLMLSTAAARDRLGWPVQALPAWQPLELARPGGGTLRVTGVPALHGPKGSEPVVGPVTGFLLSGDGLRTVYVSGDNASLDVVRTIKKWAGGVDVAVLFAGAARTALLDGALLTLDADSAAEAARILQARVVAPLHFEHWAHFTQGREALIEAFTAAGLPHLLHLPSPGRALEL